MDSYKDGSKSCVPLCFEVPVLASDRLVIVECDPFGFAVMDYELIYDTT